MNNLEGLHKIESWNQQVGNHNQVYSPSQVRQRLEETEIISVILDDDPTGSQTSHNIEVLATIDKKEIKEIIEEGKKAFFILTNDRSLPANEASELIEKIGDILVEVSKELNVKFRVLSRGDSTLRSHFPIEIEIIKKKLCSTDSLCLVVPAFFEGNRFTFQNIHYAVIDGELLEASKTEFAKDPDFTFNNSNLVEWILEKDPEVSSENIGAISLDELRKESPENLTFYFNDRSLQYLVINALEYKDLYKVSGIIHQYIQDRELTFQTAASFVKAYLGLDEKPLCQRKDLGVSTNSSGIIIAGSHVEKTTKQLKLLLKDDRLIAIELDNEKLVTRDEKYILRISNKISQCLIKNVTPVVFTGRKKVEKDDLPYTDIGKLISESLCEIVRLIKPTPDFIITKGGITSHNIATKALQVNRATVVGQWIPGVPIWMISHNDKTIPYIIFPGNVGDENALLNAFKKLKS